MRDVLAVLLVVGCFAAVLGALAWLGSRLRRRGVGGDVMGPFDEIWHPAARRFRAEIEVYQERLAPLPPAEDERLPTPRGICAGSACDAEADPSTVRSAP
ncbi:MAG TPA: hypothetical protein VF054_02625 [Micromonosporaceae bacterium]